MLKPGDKAPDLQFELDGKSVKLSDFQGEQAVVLYFYPKDGTPICTKQACYFRDAGADFAQAGAQVIGVSADDATSHASFRQEHGLTFPLASDPGGRIAKSYGIRKTLGLLPGRVTFVIDREGVIRHVFEAQFSAQKHVSEALESLKSF